MSYFNKFPKVVIDGKTVTDIFRHVSITGIGSGIYEYLNFNIPNGDRPDVVSQQLYGTPDFAWTFFLANDHLAEGLAAWPVSSSELERKIILKDQGIATMVFPTFSFPGSTMTYSTQGVPMDPVFLPYLELVRFKQPYNYAVPVESFDPDLFELRVKKDKAYRAFGSNDLVDFKTYFTWDKLLNSGPFKFWLNPAAPLELQQEWFELMKQDMIINERTIGLNSNPSLYRFYAANYFVDSSQAPAYYYNPLDRDEVVYAADSYTSDAAVSNYITRAEQARSNNDAATMIKVIRPNYIRQFVADVKNKLSNA